MRPEGLDSKKFMMVLLPGMDGTGALFKAFVAQISDGADVVIVSYPENVYLTYEQLAQHVRNFLPTSVPYVIIAESYSGPVASLLAENPLGELKAVVFVSSFVSFPWGRIGSWIGEIVPTSLLRLRPPAWVLRWFLMDSATSDTMVSEVQETIARIPPEVLVKRLREALKANFAQALKKSIIRTVCLLPESDRLIGNQGYRGLLGARPDIETVKVHGPHFLLQCAPENCLAALQNIGLLDNRADEWMSKPSTL